jgi:hypothetical protein
MATAYGAPPIYADVFRFGRQRVAWINYRHAVARRRKLLENVESGMQIILDVESATAIFCFKWPGFAR